MRGQVVHLDETLRAVLARHDYPEAVQSVLGQALAATVLMASTLKFDGRMTLQIQGDGPLNLVVVQCTHTMQLRALARWQRPVPAGRFSDQTGQGRMTITIDTDRRRRPYQGIVPLTGASLQECLSAYFETSEQLPTRLWLAAGRDRCGGMLLQRLPGTRSDDDAEDDWRRVNLLAETLTHGDELVRLGNVELLNRLFYGDDVRLFEACGVEFRCTCSDDGIETMLVALGEKELGAILAEQGEIRVVCEFCNESRRFDRVDVARLLRGHGAPDNPPSVH